MKSIEKIDSIVLKGTHNITAAIDIYAQENGVDLPSEILTAIEDFVLRPWQEEIREDQRKKCAKAGKDWLRKWFYFENKAGLSSGEALLAIKKAILNAGKSPEGEKEDE